MTHSPLTKLAALLFAVLSTIAHAQDIGWYNGKTSPYSISAADELKGLQSLVANGTDDFGGKIILLANDIALSGNWTPIGDGSSPFQGVFDGKGYTISGLSIDVSFDAGLFGTVGANGQIKNINVIATTIKGFNAAGVLAGYYGSSKSIENCSAKATSVTYVSSQVNAVGGLVGYTSAALTITNSYASVSVTGCGNGNFPHYSSGGLVGRATAALTITNSYASGNVSGCNMSNGRVGGLVGSAQDTLTITNSYASGNVSSDGAGAGAGSDNSCGGGNGGLVGYTYYPTVNITNSYASGNVTSSEGVNGGLVGNACYATVNITNSYASGNIGGGAKARRGGIFGRYRSGTMTNVYYKSEGVSQASGQNTISSGVFALTSDNLKKKNNFLGWDFNEIWRIVEGYSYPYLKIYPPSNIYTSLNDTLEIQYTPEQAYTGSQIKPEPIVRLKTGGTPLTKDTDYRLTYGTNKNAGTNGTITITGIEGYYGLKDSVSFGIIPKMLTISDAAAQNKVYNGNTTATVTGTLAGIATGDIVSVGTGKFASKDAGNAIAVSEVTLTGTLASNYRLTQPTGLTANITKKPLTITLSPKTITLAQSDPISNFSNYVVYSGLVTGDNKNLISGTTGLYDMSDMPILAAPAVGKHPVKLSGTRTADNYTITYDNEDLYLEVIADPVNLSTCTIDIPAQTYTGSQIQPTVSVTCDTATLTEDDYTIAYGANINAGTTAGTVTLTGKGAYTGTKTETFAIDKKALTVTGAAAEDKTYDGTTAATITGAELELSGVIGTDAVSLANHTAGTFASANAGEDIAVSANMSLAGTAAGNYSVTQPSDLKANITPKALPADAIQAIAAQTHTGTEITPAITVKDGSSTLASGTDYTAEFADNIDVGTATVTVTGKGNYSGTATANFAINARPSSSSVTTSSSSTMRSSSSSSSSSAVRSSSSGAVISSSSSVMLSSSSRASTLVTSSSSSATQQPSSSTTPPSSSGVTPSSSSNGGTPIRLPQFATANQASQIHNGINLHATSKAVVEVYGLNGSLVSRQNFGSGVYTVSFGHLPKGMYIVKVSYGSEKKMLRMPVN
jgi:hypothetical protein